jgi:hypothetical protein
MGVSATSYFGLIPLHAARHVHHLISEEKAADNGSGYQPKFFNPHQWQTLQKLCELIIPHDEQSAGALEANAPEFIDLLTSENPDFQVRLAGGLAWLDNYCIKLYRRLFLDCSPEQQKGTLELLGYRKNSTAEISQGIDFFAFLRDFTVDGFYTSKIGIKDIGYTGCDVMREFPGCPPLPEN